LYSPPNIIRMIKWRKMIWARHIARMWELANAYKVLEDLGVDEGIILNCKEKLSRYTPWRRMGERRYSSYSYLTSALDGDEWSASHPDRALPPGERAPGTHWMGGWVGTRTGLDAEARRKILCLSGIEPWSSSP
jgi:hypothetical protein